MQSAANVNAFLTGADLFTATEPYKLNEKDFYDNATITKIQDAIADREDRLDAPGHEGICDDCVSFGSRWDGLCQTCCVNKWMEEDGVNDDLGLGLKTFRALVKIARAEWEAK